MAKFQPGQSGNPAGRPKGSKNRITEELREAFALLLENNLEQYEIWLAQVAAEDPAKALDLALKISERFVPMLSRQEITGKDGSDIFKSVTFKFGDDINITTENIDLDD